MLAMQGHFVSTGRRGRFLAMRYGSGGIAEGRNKAAAQFMEHDDEWLFWIDTDMGFTADTVDRLLASADKDKRPVVGGLCFANKETEPDGLGGFLTFPVPTIYQWGKDPATGNTGFVSMHEYPRNKVVECNGTGSACILIHRSVIQRIFDKSGERWYTQIQNPDTGQVYSEDLSFCLRCAEHDIPIHIDTSVKTSHLKPVWLSSWHHEMALAAAEAEHVTAGT